MSAAKQIRFEERLSGGHPNSLGDTVKVVEEVLKQPKRFQELFDCYFSDDEVVRLRTSNAMKRVARENKALLVPYLDAMLDDILKIPQPSVHWMLTQLFALLTEGMSKPQLVRAKKFLKKSCPRIRLDCADADDGHIKRLVGIRPRPAPLAETRS